MSTANSGVSTLTSDSCAGCHRAHTAQGEALINAPDQEQLCLNCHGTTGSGASVNVEDGVQYTLASRTAQDTPVLGALRDGGFVNTAIDSSSPIRATYPRTATDASFRAKVPVANTAGVVDENPVTSAHLAIGGNGVVLKNTPWGNGSAGAAADNGHATVPALECTSCHNPHGNGQYRILNTLPSYSGNGFVDPVKFTVGNGYAFTDRFFTTNAHGLIVGGIVTATGVNGLTDGQYIVTSVPTGTSFKLATAPTKTSADLVTGVAVDILADFSAGTGTIQRFAAIVDDAPVPGTTDSGVASSVERNYTIQQVRGYQGSVATYILYASQVPAAGSHNVNFVADIVGATPSGTISGTVYTNYFTTSLAHGFAVGDTVTIAGLSLNSNGSATIATIPSSTTFTTGATLVTETAGTAVGANIGTVTKAVSGTFGPTAGDYFHRTVPWNPAVVNPTVTAAGVATTCNTYSPPTGGVSTPADFSSGCLTAQDAPNGRPATVSSTSTVNSTTIKSGAYGQVAFNDQISAWCSTCHTRYYSSTNPNPGGEPSSSADVARNVASVSGTTITVSTPDANGTIITSAGFSVGDIVKFTGGTYGTTDLTAGTWDVVAASSSARTFSVSATLDGSPVTPGAFTGPGTVVRLYPGSASSWYFSRPNDSTYKYQHQTTTNRSCVTCHVGHGTSATMATGAGTYTGSVKYPDGTAGTGADNSRLLKIDNRGTCQMCHDPTGTLITLTGTTPGAPGTVLPTGATQTVP